MKKILLTLVAVLSLAWAMPSQAQIKFGVVGGLNLSKLSFSDYPDLSSDNRCGWYIGPKVEFTVPIVGLGVDASLQYSQRKMNVGQSLYENSSTYKSIEIPINLKYTIGLGSLAAIYASTGPQFGFNVGSKNWAENFRMKDANVTWNVGAGVKLLGHLEIGAGYNFAVTKFATGWNAHDQEASFKTNSWQVQVGYIF